MSDSIFEQLFELFRSPGPVNWKLAAEVTKSVTPPAMPIEPHLADEFAGLAYPARSRLATVTALDVPDRALIPIDPRRWAEANSQSFRFLVEPLAEKMTVDDLDGLELPGEPGAAPGESMGGLFPMFGSGGGGAGIGDLLKALGPALIGMQMGSMIGFLSRRVLGQFDVGLPTMDHDDRYLVVPTIEDFASSHGLDRRQVRLWAVLHELAHGAVLAVPWVRAHFRSLMDAFHDSLEFDMGAATQQLEAFQDPARLAQALEAGGDIGGMVGFTPDAGRLEAVQAFLATVEGYGDHLVARAATGAGGDVLPNLGRIDEAYQRRRSEPEEGAEFLQQLIGLELDRHRARTAAEFFAAVDQRWGREAAEAVWSGPESLPTLAELEDPVGYAARVLLESPDLSGIEGLEPGDDDPPAADGD